MPIWHFEDLGEFLWDLFFEDGGLIVVERIVIGT